MTYLSQPVAWQLVSLPFKGFDRPLLFSRAACKIKRATFFVHIFSFMFRVDGCFRILCGLGTYRGGGEGASFSFSVSLVVAVMVEVSAFDPAVSTMFSSTIKSTLLESSRLGESSSTSFV